MIYFQIPKKKIECLKVFIIMLCNTLKKKQENKLHKQKNETPRSIINNYKIK